jgi:hypothetical protein
MPEFKYDSGRRHAAARKSAPAQERPELRRQALTPEPALARYVPGPAGPPADLAALYGVEKLRTPAAEEKPPAPEAHRSTDAPPLPAREQPKPKAHSSQPDDAPPLPAREQPRPRAHPAEPDDTPPLPAREQV